MKFYVLFVRSFQRLCNHIILKYFMLHIRILKFCMFNFNISRNINQVFANVHIIISFICDLHIVISHVINNLFLYTALKVPN